MGQEGQLVRGPVQLEHSEEHCRKGHVLGFPTVKDLVKNIRRNKLAHTGLGKGICTGPETP